MNDNRNYKAIRRSAVVEVAGAEIELGKVGAITAINDLASAPVLGPFFEKMGDKAVDGGAVDKGSVKSTLEDAIKSSGVSTIEAIRMLPGILRGLIDQVVLKNAVVRDEAHRAELIEFVGTFDEEELFVLLAGFLKLNLPSAYGPFVRTIEGLLASIQNSEPAESDSSNTNDGKLAA